MIMTHNPPLEPCTRVSVSLCVSCWSWSYLNLAYTPPCVILFRSSCAVIKSQNPGKFPSWLPVVPLLLFTGCFHCFVPH